MTDRTTRPARHRGVFRLDENILAQLINLPAGQRIIGFRDNPLALAIDVHIEGDGLPVCPPSAEPPVVNVDDYVNWPAMRWVAHGKDLAEMVEVIAARLDDSADGDAGSYARDLRRVLAGEYDPRREVRSWRSR
jgi:hypothetical protein